MRVGGRFGARGLRAAAERQGPCRRPCSTTRSSTATSPRPPRRSRTPATRCASRPKRKKRKGGLLRKLLLLVVGRRRRRRRQRGPAQQGARRAVRQGGGVRLHLHDRAEHRRRPRPPRRPTPPAVSVAQRPRRMFREGADGALSCVYGDRAWRQRPPTRVARGREGRSASSTRCARASPSAASPARRSTTSRARPASRAGCCTTTSAPRSGCWSRSSAATATCAWTSLDEQLAGAASADDFIDAARQLARGARARASPSSSSLVFELFTLSRRNEEIAAEFAELMRRTREHVAALLAAKQAEGVLQLARRARGRRRRAVRARRRPGDADAGRARRATGRRRSRPASARDPRRCSTRASRLSRLRARCDAASHMRPRASADSSWLAGQPSSAAAGGVAMQDLMLRLDRRSCAVAGSSSACGWPRSRSRCPFAAAVRAPHRRRLRRPRLAVAGRRRR